MGWHVVVAKSDNFKVNDKVVYCEIDSLLPEKPEFEFLRQKHFRIKTIKLRGQISQGIVFPMSILPKTQDSYSEDDDVTDVLGIVKWEPYEEPVRIPAQYVKYQWKSWIPRWLVLKLKHYEWFRSFAMNKALTWPQFLQKTDEDRVQICGKLLYCNKGKTFYYTEKLDGSSITVYNYNNKVGVCSRNIELHDNGNNFWDTAKKLELTKQVPDGFAIQGELIGPGIQQNKYKLTGFDIRIFSVYNIKERKYLAYKDFIAFCLENVITTVPVLSNSYILDTDIDAIVDLADGPSRLNRVPREGLVFRCIDDSSISFKAINPKFLLKFDE